MLEKATKRRIRRRAEEAGGAEKRVILGYGVGSPHGDRLAQQHSEPCERCKLVSAPATGERKRKNLAAAGRGGRAGACGETEVGAISFRLPAELTAPVHRPDSCIYLPLLYADQVQSKLSDARLFETLCARLSSPSTSEVAPSARESR